MNDKVTDERLKQLSTMSWVSNFQYEAKRMATELLSLRHPAPCVWTQDVHGTWTAGCGQIYAHMNGAWCCFCGHPIKAKEVERGEVKHWRHTDGKLTCKTVNDVVTECTIPQWVSNIIDWNWAWTLIDIGEYERARTPAPISVAGAGAARLVGVDIATPAKPAVEPWIKFNNTSNIEWQRSVWNAIEQCQRAIDELRKAQ